MSWRSTERPKGSPLQPHLIAGDPTAEGGRRVLFSSGGDARAKAERTLISRIKKAEPCRFLGLCSRRIAEAREVAGEFLAEFRVFWPGSGERPYRTPSSSATWLAVTGLP